MIVYSYYGQYQTGTLFHFLDYFLPVACILSSLARDWTCASCSESIGLPNHWATGEVPEQTFFFPIFLKITKHSKKYILYYELEVADCSFQKGLNNMPWDFPGSPVVKNPPCNAGNVGRWWEQIGRGLEGCRENSLLFLSEMGSLNAEEQRKGVPRLKSSQALSGGCTGNRFWGGRRQELGSQGGGGSSSGGRWWRPCPGARQRRQWEVGEFWTYSEVDGTCRHTKLGKGWSQREVKDAPKFGALVSGRL